MLIRNIWNTKLADTSEQSFDDQPACKWGILD